jgi:hypothetical protein
VSAANPTLELSPQHERLFEWIVRGAEIDGLPPLVEGFARAQQVDGAWDGGYRRLLRGPRRLEDGQAARVAPRPRRPDALAISPRQRLDDAVKAVSDLPFGGTDCALPMRYARVRKREIDTFVIFTDSETWAGEVHPAQALREYRQASGIDARLVVVGMVSNGFSIADPADPGMLDVVGFDTATPQLVSDFARGALW